MEMRWYQSGAVDASIEYITSGKKGHPIVVIPTGGGKTIIICGFCDEYLSRDIKSNILVLSHVRSILGQNYAALSKYFEGFDVGLYSAGLESRTIKKITVAGIQSVYKQPELFVDFNVIIIDECHLVTMDESGMYRKFFKGLNDLKSNRGYEQVHIPYLGLTATHFRLGHGYIHQGEGALFTDIVYDMSSRDNYNRLVAEGYLSKLIVKATDTEMNVEGIRTTAGDFNLQDLSDSFDREEITDKIVLEIIKYGKNYNKWLIFAIDIDHCEHIARTFNANGIKAVAIHSKMEDDYDQTIKFFNDGYYRVAVSVDMLSTGFDVPSIDLIAHLRPTKSPIFHVQSNGRGARVVYADGYDISTIDGRLDAIANGPKKHCLVLDFAGNAERLGPINDVQIRMKGDKKGPGGPITKRCPVCACVYHPSVKICDACGYEFQFKTNLHVTASTAQVVKESIVGWVFVDSVTYRRHQGKEDKPDSMLVQYQCGYSVFKEWICYEHVGYPKHKADHWVRFRLPNDAPMPTDLEQLLEWSEWLNKPMKIKVDATERYPRILDAEFE